MKTFFVIAFRNLIQARRRTFVLGSAIAFVAALLLVLLSLTQSIKDGVLRAATTISSGHVNVAGFFKTHAKSSTPLIQNRAKIRDIISKNITGVASITDRNRGWGRMISAAGSINVGMNGVIVEESEFLKTLALAEEADYKPQGTKTVKGNISNFGKQNTAIIFAAQAKKLEVDVGDTLTFVTEATGGQTSTVDLTIVSIAKDVGFLSNWNVFVPRQTVLNLYQNDEDTTGAIMIYLKDINRSQQVLDQLTVLLKSNNFEVLDHDPRPFFFKFQKIAAEDWRGLKLDLTLWEDEVSFLSWIIASIQGLSIFLVVILNFIIAIGIANSMWMVVRERTKEIGTLRAIGMQKSQVLQLFVIESSLLGFLGTSIGIGIVIAILTLLNKMHIAIANNSMRMFLLMDQLHFSYNYTHILITIILIPTITTIAAIYPAWKGSRMRPVEALQQGK